MKRRYEVVVVVDEIDDDWTEETEVREEGTEENVAEEDETA